MPTILGVNFLGEPETLEKNKTEKFSETFRHQNSLRNSATIFLKLAGPKSQCHPKSALQNLGLNALGGTTSFAS